MTIYAKNAIFWVYFHMIYPYALMNFVQSFVGSSSGDKGALIRFWGEKIKGKSRL